ncbi:MAG TPA: CYCXC family (seleno)protein [Candidatus Binataceae bacterium]|nr:CYCXC family (seleno)protein [Candidatus Binataceae bacterium]
MPSRTKNEIRGAQRGRARNRRWIFAAIAAVAIVAVGVGAWTMRSAADSATATNVKGERPTLDPARFFGVVREAYEVAQKNPALLAQLHCYCGCDKEVGHRNLLDCYRDEHGAHCPICTGEAVEAAKLADEGLPVEQIRRVLRDHYAQGN